MLLAAGSQLMGTGLRTVGKNGTEVKESPSHEQNLDMDVRCEICNKSYTRPDLRDRHRRRCIAKEGRERKSKRKSCDTCAKKKIRCSLSRPSCLRCTQLGTTCRYPQSPALPRRPGQGGAMTMTDQPQLAELDEMDYPSGAVDMMDILPVAAPAESQDLLADHPQVFSAPMLGSGDPLPNSIWNDYDFSNMQFIDPALTDDFLSSTNATGVASLPSNDALAALSDFQSTESDFLSNMGSLHSGPLPSAGLLSDGRSNSEHLSTTQQNVFIPGKEEARPPGQIGSSHSSPSDISWRDGSANGDSSTSAKLTTRLYSPAHLIFGHTFTIRMGPNIRTDASSLCKNMLGHLREYPGLVLDREFWSPFVHHRLYRCSLGGMAEPMANVLACVGAYASCAGSSFGLVNRMINEEREKLVRKFHSYTNTPEPCLAALHAVCIYQIMGLFGDAFIPAAHKKPLADVEDACRRREEFEKEAELHSSFLLKMTRRLSSLHAKTLHVHHEDENDWDQWKFMESLRRNMFFIHIINVLESKARQLNENYFEPLGDDLILRIPLPAPERMWRACSAEEWFMARAETLGSQGDPTARPRTLQQLLQAVDKCQVDVSALLPVTRMILASAIITPPGSVL